MASGVVSVVWLLRTRWPCPAVKGAPLLADVPDFVPRARRKGVFVFSCSDHHDRSCCVTQLQAVAVGNPAYRDAPVLPPPSGLSLPAAICPLIWFQLGSFEAELNPSGRVKSSEPALSLLTFES